MDNALSRILAYKAEEVAARKAAIPLSTLEARAQAASPVRGFAAALAAAAGPGLIAEVKKASPSKGLIRADFDPAAIARAYAAGGAHCLSVLTDAPSFQGDDAYVAVARAACPLPALRKEFMIDPWQVTEARALEADAMARDLVQAAAALGMDALIETHDAAEMERALALPARLIGVNNRDLRTFETRLATTEALAAVVPPDRLLIAESGIAAPGDIARLTRAGARAFLVGESLMRQPDVEAATRALLAPA